jgi:hypothetical protein
VGLEDIVGLLVSVLARRQSVPRRSSKVCNLMCLMLMVIIHQILFRNARNGHSNFTLEGLDIS